MGGGPRCCSAAVVAGGAAGEARRWHDRHPGACSALRAADLLEAGLRADLRCLRLPIGGCGLCLCSINGRVEHGLTSAACRGHARAGQALMCCAVPLEDLVSSWEAARPAAARAPARGASSMSRCRPTCACCWRPRRAPASGQPVLNIVLTTASGARSPSPARRGKRIELHVRLWAVASPRMSSRHEGRRYAAPGGPLAASLQEAVILFTRAQRFAPVKSIVEDAFHRGIRRPMRLYWGVRHRDDLYQLDLAERWQREHEHFSVVPVLSDGQPDDG
jgi:hypothetical protein